MPGLDPEILERLRRGIPLRMDRMGGFWLGDEPVTHPRVLAAFRRGLDRSEAGEHTLHVGNQWCYIEIDDCPLRATAVTRDDHGQPQVRLDDGRTLPLPVADLVEHPEDGLWMTAPSSGSGRGLRVRFTNRAQMDLAPWLVFDDHTQEMQLVLEGGTYAIPRHENVVASH